MGDKSSYCQNVSMFAKNMDTFYGHVHDVDTFDKIRTGNSIIRNSVLVSYVAKGVLPYGGLGSGIKRALEAWPEVDFVDDRDGCLFTATVHRKTAISSEKGSENAAGLPKSLGKFPEEEGFPTRCVENWREFRNILIC